MNGLMVNAGKSEALLVGTAHVLHTVAWPCVVNIAKAPVECKKTITLLGVPLDGSQSMDRCANSKVARLCAISVLSTDQTVPQSSTSQ